MRIEQLNIQAFRNIASASLQLDPAFNAIVGKNGAGKSSVLEAIYTLGYGRSFRSRLTDPLIRRGEAEFVVFARGKSAGGRHNLGISKSPTTTQVRIDGQVSCTLGDLVRMVPVVEIDASSLDIIDLGPGLRRAYVDWGVFHVEQQPSALWGRFRRLLQQRNSLLKQGNRGDLDYWDGEFVALGEAVDHARRAFLQQLLPEVIVQTRQLLGDQLTLEVEYQPGWIAEESLHEQLMAARERDFVLGRTTRGPHLADLQFGVQGAPARDALSRGQKKLLVAALKFAMAKLYNSSRTDQCILLLDDFPAELDTESVAKIRLQLKELDCQIVAAAVEPDDLRAMNPGDEARLFHVEHGRVEPITESL